jgi:hypothetical protein
MFTQRHKPARWGKIVVTCTGIFATESIDVFWDSTSGKLLASTNAVKGAIELTIGVPESAGGAHKIIVRGNSSKKQVSKSFTVAPRVALSPSSGDAGSKVSVKLTGFHAGETVSISGTRQETDAELFEPSSPAMAARDYDHRAATRDGGSHKVEARGGMGASRCDLQGEPRQTGSN